jgi:hypothetical protein
MVYNVGATGFGFGWFQGHVQIVGLSVIVF